MLGSTREQRDLKYFWQVVKRYRIGLTLINLSVLVISFVIASTTTPTYRSTALLFIEPTRFNIATYADRLVPSLKYREFYETQFQMLRSPNLAYRVIDALDLWSHPELQHNVEVSGRKASLAILEDPQAPQARTRGNSDSRQSSGTDAVSDVALPQVNTAEITVLANFMRRLRVVSIERTQLIRVMYDSSDRQLAARVANTLARQFISDGRTIRMQAAKQSEQNLERALATAQQSLANTQRLIERFRQQYDVSDRSAMTALSESEVLLSGAQLVDAEQRLSELKNLLRSVRSLKNDRANAGTLPALQQDPILQQLLNDRHELERRRASLLSRFGNRHPRVVSVDSQLQSVARTLDQRITTLIAGIEQDVRLAERRAASARQQVDASKHQARELSGTLTELKALQRQANGQQSLVDRIGQRLREVRSADTQLESEAALYEPAVAALAPYRPHIPIFMSLAVLTSLIFSVLVAGVLARVDDRVASVMQLRRLGLAVLGELPRRRSRSTGAASSTASLTADPVTDSSVTYGTYDDAVDSLRTILLHGRCRDPGKVVMMVSAQPGEGKSFACADLALSLARSGKRVLIVDVDVRRAMRNPVEGAPMSGLVGLLEQAGSPATACQRLSRDPRVSVLSYGRLHERAGSLLRSPRLPALFERLRANYDHILVDVSPLLACADALLFSAVCDSALFVVKSGCTRVYSVQQTLGRLAEVRVPVVGAVLTGVRSAAACSVNKPVWKLLQRRHALVKFLSNMRQQIA